MRTWMILAAAAAFTVAPAAAVFDPDAVPVSEQPALRLALEARNDGCEEASPCLAMVEGNLTGVVNGLALDVTVENDLDETIFFRFATEGHMDDPVDDAGQYSSVRSEVLAEGAIEPGSVGHWEFRMPGDARAINLTATAGGEPAGHLRQEISVYTIASGPGEPDPDSNLNDRETQDPPPVTPDQGPLDRDRQPTPSGDGNRDDNATPFLPIVLAIGVLGLVAGFRRERQR